MSAGWTSSENTATYSPPPPSIIPPAANASEQYCPWINATSQGNEPGYQTLLRVLSQPPKSNALETYNVQISPTRDHEREPTPAERDAEDETRLKKLKRLGALYLGKSKKGKEKEKKTPKTPTKDKA